MADDVKICPHCNQAKNCAPNITINVFVDAADDPERIAACVAKSLKQIDDGTDLREGTH